MMEIEKVARAMWLSVNEHKANDPHTWDTHQEASKELWLKCARAAIEAIQMRDTDAP